MSLALWPLVLGLLYVGAVCVSRSAQENPPFTRLATRLAGSLNQSPPLSTQRIHHRLDPLHTKAIVLPQRRDLFSRTLEVEEDLVAWLLAQRYLVRLNANHCSRLDGINRRLGKA